MVKAASLVYCVVVNWNGWQDTVNCAESLLAQRYPSLHILLVDNGSTNDSVQRIRSALPQVELLDTGVNRGFAAGCNAGMELALQRGAEFVWLLNNDTVVPPDTLDMLVAEMANPRVAIAGSVLRFMHDPSRIQAWGGGVLWRWIGFARHFFAPSQLGPTSFLTFASVLLRSEFLRTNGLLDEGFFMYFEDADMSFRARAAGWQLAVASETAILHKEGGSSASTRNLRMDRVVTASGLRFLGRYGKPRHVSQVLFLLSRLAKRTMRGDFQAVKAVLQGAIDWFHHRPEDFLQNIS